MSEESKPVKRRWAWRYRWFLVFLTLLGLAAATLAVLSSSYMQRWVRAQVIHRLEAMSGGRVELGDLTWQLYGLRVVASDLTIHGTEAAGEAPYFHADRIDMKLKVVAAANGDIGFRDLEIEHPVFHLIVYPDGHTNQPAPAGKGGNKSSRADDVSQVFALSIDRATVRDGQVLVNNRVIPFDFDAQGVRLGLNYVRHDNRYEMKVGSGRIATSYKGRGQIASSLQAELTFFTTQVAIRSARWNAGSSWAELSGKLVNYSDPQITLQYKGEVDIPTLAMLAGIQGLRRGTLQLEGSGGWSALAGPTGEGKALLKNGEYHAPEIQLPNVNAGGQYKVTRSTIAISQIFATVFGGVATGTVTIKDWLTAKSASGAAALELRRAVAAELAYALASPGFPLDKLKLRGLGEGTVKLAWKGTPADATVDFSLEVVPLSAASHDELPLTARLAGSYSLRRETLQVSNGDFAARSLWLQLTGVTGPTSSDFKANARAGDLRDVAPVLAALAPRDKLPEGVTGSGQFSGTVAGRTGATEFAGALELHNLDVPSAVLKPQQANVQAGLVHFDSLSGKVDYSPGSFTVSLGVIQSGAEQIAVDGSVGLERGLVTPESPLALQLAIRNAAAPALLELGGYKYPITGTVNAELHLTGTRGHPQGEGAVHLSRGTAWDEVVNAADAKIRLRNQSVELTDLVVRSHPARLVGAGTFNLTSSEFRFNLQGSNLDLLRMPQLQWARGNVTGMVNFTLSGYGTPQAPVLDGALRVEGLTVGGEPVGSMTIQAVTEDETLRLTGRSNFRDESFSLDGTIILRERLATHLDVKFAHLDVDSLLETFLRGRLTGHSATTGTLTLTGPLREPQQLAVVLNVDDFTASVERVRLNNQGPIRAVIRNGVAQIEQLHLVGTETDFSALGSIDLTGRREVKIDADGQINMILFQSLDPDVHSAGLMKFRLTLAGVLARPTVNGEVNISKGAFSLINLPNGLSDINGTLVFNQDRLQVQNLTAQSGGGQMQITGFLTYGKVVGFNLNATGKDIRLRYGGMSSTLNADLRLTGNVQNALLSGQMTVTRFSLGSQLDLAYLLSLSRVPTSQVLPSSPLNNWRFNVHLLSTPELEVQSSLATVTGNVDLSLRGTAAHPALLGRVSMAEGKVNFNGTKYELTRGDVSFTNPVQIEPILDVELTTRVRDYDVTLGFHGPINRLATTYRSEPPLATSDIIALLAFGQTQNPTTATSQPTAFMESASNAIIAQALNATVSDRVQKLFGVSRIKIAPDVTSTFANPNTQVSIEQQVSNNITLTYITSLTQSAQQIIQVEYNINRNLSIVAVRDQFGVLSFDVRMRKRKK